MEATLAELAELAGGELRGDPHKCIAGVAPFESAGPDQITYAAGRRFLSGIGESSAGAIIVPPDFTGAYPNLILSANPQLAFIRIVRHLVSTGASASGIDSCAVIGENFVRGVESSIGPLVSIGNSVTIGDRVLIHAGVVIGDHVSIGDDAVLFPNVVILERTRIGCRVIIQAGTVIGSDGFGYVPDGERHCKIPHLGFVQIDDDVEIGAGNAIDRGTFGRTWIQKGVKTDNLVHVAHNVTVGENTLLIAQAGIAGSVTIGRNVILAGQAGVVDHLHIGDRAVVGPQTGVTRSVAPGEVVMGMPEMPHRQWLRVQRTIADLPRMVRKLADLEKQVARLSKRIGLEEEHRDSQTNAQQERIDGDGKKF